MGHPLDRVLLDDVIDQSAPLAERMRAVVDVVWETMGRSAEDEGEGVVSWAGFYLGPGVPIDDESGRRVAGEDEMLLGPMRPKPACSPIGLHGACGRALRSGRSLVVTDVKKLGEGYVACDPRDASELVVPVFDDGGRAVAVLDLDSFETDAFDEADAAAVTRLLSRAGVTLAEPGGVEVV